MKRWFLDLKRNFDSRANLKRASINSSWLLVEQIVRLLVGFLISVATTRYLGPNGLGLLSYANSWACMFVALISLGLDSVVVKKLIENKGNEGTILGSSFLLRSLGSILATVLSVSSIVLLGKGDLTTILLVLVVSFGFVFQSSGIFDLYYQSKLKVRYTTGVRIVVYLIIVALKFSGILLSASLYYFAFLFSLEMVLTAVGYGIVFYGKEKIKLVFDWVEAKDLFLSALPIFLSALVIGFYSRVDQILVGTLINKEVLGYYSLAVTLIQMFYFVPTIVISSVFPILVEEKTNLNLVSYRGKILKTIKYLSIFAVSLIICANVSSRFLIRLLYGEQFKVSADLLNIYVWNLLPVFAASIFSYWLVIENKQKLILYFQIITLVVGLILNYSLIKIYGVYGAGYSTLIVNFLMLILYVLVFLRSITRVNNKF